VYSVARVSVARVFRGPRAVGRPRVGAARRV